MKRTMYQATRHTPKGEAGGSIPFWRAKMASCFDYSELLAFFLHFLKFKSIARTGEKDLNLVDALLIGFELFSTLC